MKGLIIFKKNDKKNSFLNFRIHRNFCRNTEVLEIRQSGYLSFLFSFYSWIGVESGWIYLALLLEFAGMGALGCPGDNSTVITFGSLLGEFHGLGLGVEQLDHLFAAGDLDSPFAIALSLLDQIGSTGIFLFV